MPGRIGPYSPVRPLTVHTTSLHYHERPPFRMDAAKAALNIRKHGVTFDESATAFQDEEALVMPDPDHSIGEERFVLLGLRASLRLLVVVHCELEHGAVIRLISARRADRSERDAYAKRSR